MTIQDIAKMNVEQLRAYVLKQQQEAMAKVTKKVTRKGGVSVYGLQRFPVTLYPEQWQALFNANVPAFLAENASALEAQAARWNALTPAQQKSEDEANRPKTLSKGAA